MSLKNISVNLLVIKVLSDVFALRNDRQLHRSLQVKRHTIVAHIADRVCALNALDEPIGGLKTLLQGHLTRLLLPLGSTAAEHRCLAHHGEA